MVMLTWASTSIAGPDQSAGYFPASSLSSQLRSDLLLPHYLQSAGDLQRAIELSNAQLAGDVEKLHFYRFEDLPQFAPPSVYHMDPGVDSTVRSDRLQIKAQAHAPTQEPISEIFFLVNGRRVDERWFSAVGRPGIRNEGRYAEIIATLPLPQAINRISVVVKNRFNTAAPETIEVRRIGGPGELESILKPDLYVLAVGVSEYVDHRFPRLRYAHSDALAVAAGSRW
jgi:hypothetical protein